MTNYLNNIISMLNNYEEVLLSNISESNQPLFLLSLSILILSSICMICVIQITISLLVLYVIEHKDLLDRLSKYPYITKIVNIYKHTRLFYLLFEIILLNISLGMIIYLCSSLVFGLLKFS